MSEEKIFLVKEKSDKDMKEDKLTGCLHFKIIVELTKKELRDKK